MEESASGMRQNEDDQKAVEQALEYNNIPDLKKLDINDTDSFLDHVNDLSTRVPSKDIEGKDLICRVEILNFIFDQEALKD